MSTCPRETLPSKSIEKLDHFDYILNTVSVDLDWDQYLSLLDR